MKRMLQPCMSIARSTNALQVLTCRALSSSATVQLTPDQHPWLGKIQAPSSFLPEERVMTFLAANVGAGDLVGVARDWQHLPPQLHGKGLEVVLQAHALAGFPRTINALMTIKELGIHPSDTKHFDESHNLDKWKEDGARTLEAVYGGVTEKLRANFKSMHPLLEAIMVEHIYGRVLSRPLVGLRMRELCTLSLLAGQNVPLQLVSHLKGALRCGATKQEVDTVVEQTALVFGIEALKQAQEVRDDTWRKEAEKKDKKKPAVKVIVEPAPHAAAAKA